MGMIPSILLSSKARASLFPSSGPSYGISRPVLRDIGNGHVAVAMFVTILDSSGMDTGMILRPEYLIFSEIENGDVLNMVSTRFPENEFSNASYDVRYDIRLFLDPPPIGYLRRTWELLDESRKEYIMTKKVPVRTYNSYLRRIQECCPVPYRRFFREAGKIYEK